MDIVFLYGIGLVAPIIIALLFGVLISGSLIRKCHTIIGIIASLVTSPVIIGFQLLLTYFFFSFRIQEIDRVMPHAPERDLYVHTIGLLFGLAVIFAAIDAVIASIITFSLSLLYVIFRWIARPKIQQPASRSLDISITDQAEWNIHMHPD